MFDTATPVVLDFHGYPSAVHQLLYGRPGPGRFHVREYVEEGTTTPYDLLASNGVSRHDLAIAALGHLRGRATVSGDLAAAHAHHRDRLREEVRRAGTDPAEITQWKGRPRTSRTSWSSTPTPPACTSRSWTATAARGPRHTSTNLPVSRPPI
ncbi:hypothetical protein ACFWRV_19955 [Streptomyces sp. NPDC058576]|uniref:phosphoketolase family protein n=1 Tax=Streptomyces sp. NPDC058576 TaxID=3346547 RepID=UPI003651310D